MTMIKEVKLDKDAEKDLEMSKQIHLETSTETKIDLRDHESHSMPIDLDDLNTNKLIDLKNNIELEAEISEHGPFPI